MAEPIIHDGNYTDFINPTVNGEVKLCSAIPRVVPFGKLGFAAEASVERLSRSRQIELIREAKANKTRVSDRIKRINMRPLDQNGTNFCWANGPVNGVRVVRLLNNQQYEDLSPASVACQINGFRNEGGWGTEAMKFSAEKGAVPTRLWPNNAIDRRYLTPEAKVEAMRFRVTEWDDIPARDAELFRTYLALGYCIAVGYNWWRHEVLACDLEEDMSVRIWNSWGDWGEDGFGILSASKSIPDDAVVPRLAVALAA